MITPLHRIPLDVKERPHGFSFLSEVYTEGLIQADDYRKGKVKPFVTPWQGLNKSTVGGLEWNSLITIGARPGAGKTMIVSQLLREARKLNPTIDFNILEFQFEMGAKQYASREFAAQTALDYNVILSADGKALDDFAFKRMEQIRDDARAAEAAGIVRGQFHKPLTVAQIEDAVKTYYDLMGSKPMIVTIDHSWLIKKSSTEREKIEVLYNTAEMLMQLKRNLPVIFIMLTQLNRVIDEASRKSPGSIANYPTSSDIFGGDALMQGSDVVLALNNPFKAGIRSYGPKQYPANEEDIFMHLLKVRNAKLGDGVLFMKAQFNRGRLIEVPEPTPANPSGAPARFRTQNGTNGNIPLNNTSSVAASIGDEL